MKKWITERPYLVTSTVFLILMIAGWQVLYWQAEDFTFLLLLYFIVQNLVVGGCVNRNPNIQK